MRKQIIACHRIINKYTIYHAYTTLSVLYSVVAVQYINDFVRVIDLYVYSMWKVMYYSSMGCLHITLWISQWSVYYFVHGV